jgi:hypothetical protein
MPSTKAADPKASGGSVQQLCTTQDVKTQLQIAEGDSSWDVLINSLISTISYQILNAINRLDLIPSGDYTDYINLPLKQRKIFLKHYPINTITTVTLNGTDVPAWDVANPTVGGYRFIGDDPNPENQQFIEFIGYCFDVYYYPLYCDCMTSPNLIVAYNAGYNTVPDALRQACIDWVCFKRQMAQLQGANPVLAQQQIGDYSEGAGTGRVTIDFMGIDVPASVALVLDQYMRWVV